MQRQEIRPPLLVALLGYGGLIPFAGLAAALALNAEHARLLHGLLIAYACLILAFLGALHWGFAMTLADISPSRKNAMYLWSVVPALLGWVALAIHLGGWATAASVVVIAGLLAQCAQDFRLVRHHSLAAWYWPLRLRLTGVACLSLLLGAWLANT